ncbi:MAG: hypothetical protein ACI8RD_003177 [Bacillariaceae sp.]|jgi:hypothetical protein
MKKCIEKLNTVKRLNEEKDNARPADMGLFHANIEQYIDESNSHSKSIKNSVTEWAKRSERGIRTIVGWIR